MKHGAQAEHSVRRGAHLSRPLDEPVEPLHRPERTARRRALGGQLLHPGLAGDQARSHRPAAGVLARGPETRRRLRLRRRHRHARPHATALRHRPGSLRAFRAAGNVRRRPAAGRSLHDLLQIEQRRPARSCAPRRFASATRTTSASPSPAPKARCAGGRKNRRASRSTCRTSPTASIGAARSRRGDGFLPKDVPADLMAEPTIPSGHPEAFHDAFARLHRCFEADVRKWKAGEKFNCDGSKYANIEDGLDRHRLHRDLRQDPAKSNGEVDALCAKV